MISFKCETLYKLLLQQMIPFQGDLKKRKESDYAAMWQSLQTEGLLTPFVLWKTVDGNVHMLDGHCRRETILKYGSTEDINAVYPVLYIEAATEDEARKIVIQICSTYGKINNKGLRDFTAPISGYKAPLINRSLKVPVKLAKPVNDKCIVRLRVPKTQLTALLGFLKTLPYVEIY